MFGLLFLNFCAELRHIYKLDCSSRRKDRPMMEGGAAIQYVHVPKAAGTSIQQYMHYKVVKRFNRPHKNIAKRKHPERCPEDDNGWEAGFYSGHCPIISGRARTRPLFVVSIREPVSRWTSLFKYIARNEHHFDHQLLYGEMTKFKRGGVVSTDIFATMLRTRHLFAMSLLDRSQWSFLVPMGCPVRNQTSPKMDIPPLTSKSIDLAKAVLLRNLARCDLVITIDQLDKFIPQIVYHLEYGNVMTEGGKIPHSNGVQANKKREQILDQLALNTILSHPNYEMDSLAFSFATRVGRARWDYIKCELKNRNECNRHCEISVTTRELSWLTQSVPSKCIA